MLKKLNCAVLFMVIGPLTAQAQLGPNLTYDGRPTVARLKYTPVSMPRACQGSDSPAGAGWGHDYPMSVQGLMTAATALTGIDAVVDSGLVLTVEDPELMRHPVAMLTEPGCWNPTDAEAKALRTYLLKGGFLIADDFTFFSCSPTDRELAIARFEVWIKRILPTAKVVPIPETHPAMDGFFRVDPAAVKAFCSVPAKLMGIYEDNDPTKRLLVAANYLAALGHAWRYVSNTLGSGIEQGGLAYKLGLNYLVYGLSH